jgi:hypothetical protein
LGEPGEYGEDGGEDEDLIRLGGFSPDTKTVGDDEEDASPGVFSAPPGGRVVDIKFY